MKSQNADGHAPRAWRPSATTALWLIVVLLAIIATNMLSRGPGIFSLQQAMGQSPGAAGGRGIYAFIGPIDKTRTGLWMMDVDGSNVWVYEYVPATRKIRLVAARSFIYDRALQDYNCDEPSIEQVRLMLDQARRVKNRNAGLGGAVTGTGNGSEAADPNAANESAAPPIDPSAAQFSTHLPAAAKDGKSGKKKDSTRPDDSKDSEDDKP